MPGADLQSFLDTARIVTIVLDADLRIESYTSDAAGIFELAKSVVGHPFSEIASQLPTTGVLEEAARVARTREAIEREVRSDRTGTRYVMQVMPTGAKDHGTGVVVTFLDVTGRRNAEEALATSEERYRAALRALEEREQQTQLLLSELQHRVRNTLFVVRSIARRTAETSETVDDYANHLSGRLDALARVQSAVTREPSAGIDLEQLISEELFAHRAREGDEIDILSGPKVLLRPRAAELLGLAVHELAVNAVKYGALSDAGGQIRIVWQIAGPRHDRKLQLDWQESGMAITATQIRPGFGMEFLQHSLVYELEGATTVTLTPQGLNCQLTMPLAIVSVESSVPA